MSDRTRPESELLPLVYDELRRIAARYIGRERPGQKLRPRARQRAFLPAVAGTHPHFENRGTWVAIAALSMRQILVQRARARNAAKRGGGGQRVTLDERVMGQGPAAGTSGAVDLVALDVALSRLAQLDAEQARIVELRYFGGLTVDETAEAMGMSPATVKRHWAMARAWLKLQLEAA